MQPILCHLDVQQLEQPPDASHAHTGPSGMLDNGQLKLSTPEAVRPAPDLTLFPTDGSAGLWSSDMPSSSHLLALLLQWEACCQQECAAACAGR